MDNLRKYGKVPFTVAVVHGGPGAAGEMKPVAEELSKNFAILEPLQTTASLEGQVQELKSILEENTILPITLIGYSWGAWLVFILAARYPKLVKKLILISSGPFEASYVPSILETRLSHLGEQDKINARVLLKELDNPQLGNKNALEEFGKIISKADSYDPIAKEVKVVVQQNIYQGVWPEANELRRSGKLLQYGEKIQCPVVAIHGDYDPHPAKGVKEPLSKVVKDFRFILLNNCGHKPWIEREAKGQFYQVLDKELV